MSSQASSVPATPKEEEGGGKAAPLSGLMFFLIDRSDNGETSYSLGCYSTGRLEMMPMEQTYAATLEDMKSRLKVQSGLARVFRPTLQHAQALHRQWVGNDERVQTAQTQLRADRERDRLLQDAMDMRKRCLSYINVQFDNFRASIENASKRQAVGRRPDNPPAPPPSGSAVPTPQSQYSQVSTLLNGSENTAAPSEAGELSLTDGWESVFTPCRPGDGAGPAGASPFPNSTPLLFGDTPFRTPATGGGGLLVNSISGGLGLGSRIGLFHQAAARDGEHVRVLVAEPVLRGEALVELQEPRLPGHVVAHAEVDDVALAHVVEREEAELRQGRARGEVGGDVEEGVVAVGAVEGGRGLQAVLREGLEEGLEHGLLLLEPRPVLADGVAGAGVLQQVGYDVMGGLQNLSAHHGAAAAFFQSPELYGQRGVREGS
jgi:hypothetical protein